ncbi:MAG: isoprenyl transferase [Acidobacteriota bacterium]|nr:isoprenyl transferase [Acidobacteriota bacterium]
MIELHALAEPGSFEERQLKQISLQQLPRHVAIIMDGNGRWATSRSQPRVEGHRAGVRSVRETVETAARLEIEVLTLFAFSAENWKRPRFEVWTLMNLLKEYLRGEREELAARNIRLRVLGRVDEMDKSVRRELDLALEATADCTGMTLNVALNYSGRCEIVDACRRIVTDWAQGEHVEIDESTLGEYLYTSGQPDPDLVIRTSGELRLSNFLLWQIAYAEIWVTDTLWPDFRCCDFFEGILAYQQRSRRYGSIESTLKEHGAA